MNNRKIDNDCERATFLIEKKQIGALALSDAADLEIHLADCYECRVFQRQSQLINLLLHKILNASPAYSLDDNFKISLQRFIDARLR